MNTLLAPLLAFILAIFTSSYLGFHNYWYFLAAFSILAIQVYFYVKNKVNLASIIIVLVFFVLGLIRETNHNTIPKNHFLNTKKSISFYESKVLQKLNDSKKYKKYFVQVTQIASEQGEKQNATGKVLLFVEKKSRELVKAENIIFSGQLLNIAKVQNPHQFDYKEYLSKKKIYSQVFTDNTIHSNNQGFWYSVYKQREKLSKKIAANYKHQVVIFTNSLMLADKGEMTISDKDNFAKAGIAHLFAISGLHVGLLFGFLWLLFYPLRNILKGKLRYVLCILFIWFFAAFVGFQPSVSRACFMLSLFVLSRQIGRPISLNNTLIVSALVLLFINPNWLWDVGFQLSYAAVFFIGLYAKLANKVTYKIKKPFRWFANLGAVSLSAQLGTAPITIFYFHQFSIFALFVNLLIIPLVSVLFAISFLVVGFSLFDFFPAFWLVFVNELFTYLYDFIKLVAESQPERFSKVLWLLPQVFIAYFSLIFVYLYVKEEVKKPFFIGLIFCIISFQTIAFFDIYEKSTKKEIIFFNNYKKPLIGLRNGGNLNVLLKDSNSLQATKHYIEKSFAIKERIGQIEYKLLKTNKKKLLRQSITWGENQLFLNYPSRTEGVNYINKYGTNSVEITNKNKLENRNIEGAVIYNYKELFNGVE